MEKNHFKNSELFSSVTHEIKNSLNPVINLSSILLRSSTGRLTDDENSYLEVIERNGRKILNIIEEFSFLNKLNGKPQKHSYTEINVREMIDNAVIGMMAISSNAGCEMICDIDDNPMLLVSEQDVFRKIIESVCLFFISSGGDHPSIFFKAFIEDSKLILISSCKKTFVKNEEQDIFDKDNIIEKGFSRSSVMWLEFATLYINYLKGEARFSLDSEGCGIFSFSIPSGGKETSTGSHDSQAEKEVNYDSMREFVMLVIDDDVDNIIPVNAIIEHEFKGKGVVYHAESGCRGLDLLDTIKPDIVLLDITLPDISGMSLVKNIKNLFVEKNIPVIAFTGMDIGDREKMIRSGFDDIIKKPFNIDTFINKIRKWID